LRRVIWTVTISFISASLGIIWVVFQKRHQENGNHSTTRSSSPPLPPQSNNSHQLFSDPKKLKQNKTSMRFRKVIAVLLTVTSLGFFVPWLLNLAVNLSLFPPFGGLDNVATLSPPNGFESTVPVPVASYPLSFNTVSTAQGTFSEAHAILTLTINQIRNETATQASLIGMLDLSLPSTLQSQICSSSTQIKPTTLHKICGGGTPVAIPTQYQGFQLKSQFAEKGLNLKILNGLTGDIFSTTIPFKDLFPPSPSNTGMDIVTDIHIPVKLSMISQGKAYPNDWYWGQADIDISLPEGVFVYPSPGVFNLDLPSDVRVVSNSGMNNIAVNLEQEKGADPDSHELRLLAVRNTSFCWLVYLTILCLPFAFLLLIGYIFFSSKENDNEPFYSVALNAIVAVLTVIAIRQILVPPDLQAFLTRLDLILITEGTGLLMLVFVAYARQIGRKTETESKV
jgi:hypothetical protein